MSNKTQLQINNTKLNSLVETLRGDTTGGSGGSGQTVNVTIINGEGSVYYTTIQGGTIKYKKFQHIYNATSNITVVKNSIIVVTTTSDGGVSIAPNEENVITGGICDDTLGMSVQKFIGVFVADQDITININ